MSNRTELNWTVQLNWSELPNSLRPHGLEHTRLLPPCPSPTPGVCWNSCPLSWWCHPTISSSVIPFSSCPQSFPASGSYPMSQFFASGGQSIGVSASASVFPVNIFRTDFLYDWWLMKLCCCCCEVAQSCPTLCNPMDCSLPGSSVHGIFQARILEWVAISFSRGLINPISVPLTSFYSMRWGRNGVKIRMWPIGSYKDLSSVVYSDQILAPSLATCLTLGLSPTLFPHLQS